MPHFDWVSGIGTARLARDSGAPEVNHRQCSPAFGCTRVFPCWRLLKLMVSSLPGSPGPPARASIHPMPRSRPRPTNRVVVGTRKPVTWTAGSLPRALPIRVYAPHPGPKRRRFLVRAPRRLTLLNGLIIPDSLTQALNHDAGNPRKGKTLKSPPIGGLPRFLRRAEK